jgi:hypothetical protein
MIYLSVLLQALFYVRLDGVLDVQLLEVMDRIRNRGYTTIRSLKHCLELFVSDKTMLEVKLNTIIKKPNYLNIPAGSNPSPSR